MIEEPRCPKCLEKEWYCGDTDYGGSGMCESCYEKMVRGEEDD